MDLVPREYASDDEDISDDESVLVPPKRKLCVCVCVFCVVCRVCCVVFVVCLYSRCFLRGLIAFRTAFVCLQLQ